MPPADSTTDWAGDPTTDWTITPTADSPAAPTTDSPAAPTADWTAADRAVVEAQLGRPPRGAVAVAWRCPCGRPGVVATAPLLEDGRPFPTTFYLTCPRAVRLVSQLESEGAMAVWNDRLTADPDLAGAYRLAHADYLARRQALARRLGQDDRPLGQVSAGGMPERVKCLHALAGHALAAGPGINPVGDATLERLGPFWRGPCQPPVQAAVSA
ncbi:MAG: DUF501 domain-containing protein [Propionibacteriaceae bacterium]|jgi:hypothetical protein|nr:DUF501 domain-containing protein [Propionibacteriaceae bacterium]